MRDLASVVTIETKNKMFEKDKICVVGFKELGYEAIVPIENNIGDKMVFIQEGSILPEISRWEFLRKRCYRNDLKGFLIKPMTMGARDDNGQKGDRVKSWGLCVTLTEAGLDEKLEAGTDVTEQLNIKKYEPAEDASPTKQASLPKFIKFCYAHKGLRWIAKWYKKAHKPDTTNFPTDIISKSDETTIQNCKSLLEKFPGTKAFITAKLEGQSFTCSLNKKNKKFYVCSRNNKFYKRNSASAAFFDAAEKYDIESKLKAYYKKTGDILVVQGEQCGPGIQGNIYNFSSITWFVFRLKAIKKSGEIIEYNYADSSAIVNDILGLSQVPLVEVVGDMSKFDTIDSLVKYAENVFWKPEFAVVNFTYTPKANEKLWKDYLQNEGIVVKSSDYNKEKCIGFSFKVKNMSYQEHEYTEMHEIANKLSN